jgi:hypothetical protein
MQFLIGLITRSPWGLQAVISLAGALLIVCLGLGATVAVQSARLDAAKAKQEIIGNQLAEQNRAIDTWKTEAEDQKQRVEAATAQGEQVRTITIGRVRTITVAKIPTECPAAIRWGAQHALEFSELWEGKQ